MIWRLTYCNKKGLEARIDIIRGNRTPIEVVQGSGQPFTLSYKLDKNDKSGHIMTSSADIEIFETETFNIDDLKTSNETELKVEYFEDNVLTWSGFILPDFFSREIGSPNIVRMTASDRLTALKGITLSDLPAKVSLRNLIELCLEQTGLSLGLVSQIQINQGSTNILDSEILSQRLTDVRGRSISCYDILMSIMVGTNSTIRQRAGQWQVYNKLEHELRTPTIFFNKVERGAIRTIQPVASSVGVYKEFGGSKIYPENYNFKSGGAGWAVNFPEEMSASFSSKNILGFDVLVSGGGYQPVYGTEDNNPHAVIHGFRGPLNYLKSANIPIPSGYMNEIDIKFDINASGPIWNFGSHQRFSVFAVKGERTQVLTSSGFVDISNSSESEYMHMLQFEGGVVLAGELARVSTNSLALSGKLVDYDGLDGYSVHIRLYSSDRAYATIVNFASINFSPIGDSSKGDLYKTTQGSNFTKLHDVETTVFGDYITNGLNGYFYNYPIDDTSNLYLPNGELSSPTWETLFDPTERPLLHHISRQKSRLFSIAHDILKANINVESFDPLAVFQDCKGGKYVAVSASFDFLRSEVDVELEQIAYDGEILKRDYIYSYFGEGEDTVKSIGGIAGGGGGTGGGGGGGMTSDQVAILNDVAKLAHLHENKEIIDQITQDMLDNASRELVTSTDTQTELTDENILSSLRTLLEISNANEDLLEEILEEISRKYLRKDIEDTAFEKITFLKGIIASDLSTFTDLIASGKIKTEEIEVREESLFHGLAKFLKGIIASDLSTFTDLIASGKIIAEDIDVNNHLLTNTLKVILQADLQTILLRGQMNSETFASGLLGHGMRLRKNGDDWELELDNIIVRKAMTVYELIVQEIRYQAGQHIFGPAGAKLTKVTNNGSHWRCEHDGTMDFITGAQVLCQRFKVGSKAENPDGSTTFKDARIKRYWRLVTNYGSGWFNLSKTDCESGSDFPEIDDQVAVLGHRTNPDWQNAIMLVSTGSDAPYMAYYAGINSYSTVGKEVKRDGNLGGIVDAQFGQLKGFGSYAENVYLKGQFRLNNNKLIEDAINDAHDKQTIGAYNLLREYDARFEFKYWGEDGEKVEVDFNEINPHTVMILCDRDNVIVTEDNLAIKIIL